MEYTNQYFDHVVLKNILENLLLFYSLSGTGNPVSAASTDLSRYMSATAGGGGGLPPSLGGGGGLKRPLEDSGGGGGPPPPHFGRGIFQIFKYFIKVYFLD